jgi:hypothetical protein
MEGLDDDLGKCSEFCQDRQIFPLSIFDGFSRARISVFCLHLFTRVPQNVVIHADRGEDFGREAFTSVACRCDDPWVRDATCRRALTMERKGGEGG